MLAIVFVVLAIVLRFLPHVFNLTPVTGALLFFGANQPRKRAWMPLLAMIASDLLLNWKYGYALGWEMLPTFAYYAGVLLLGGAIRDHQRPLVLAGSAMGSSVAFFLISNGAVWAFGTMYPHSLAGLVSCYAAGIPFYRGTFAGDLLFTAVFFGMAYALRSMKQAEPTGAAAA